MTLDEAIKHCEEVAETQEWMSGTYDDGSMGKKLCLECASEHRQLAAWLKLLKEILDSGDCNDCKFKGMCATEPKLGQMVRYNCYCYSRKEVNADEDKGVLEKINEKQDSLRATCKAWDEAISRNGYVD